MEGQMFVTEAFITALTESRLTWLHNLGQAAQILSIGL